MKKSLQWRLVFIFVLLAFVLVAPISLFLNRKIESWYYEGFSKSIDWGFSNWPVNKSYDIDYVIRYLRDERNAISQFQINEYKSYTILPRDNPGGIIFSSDAIYEGGANKTQFASEIIASENLLKTVAGAEKGSGNKLLRYGSESYFDYARAFTLADGDYILYFRYSSEAWQRDINDFNVYILTALLILIAISLVFGYLMSKTITVPINRVMNTARSLASGNFDQVLEVKSDDEIGELTRTFNFMAMSLKNTLNEISSEKSKVETILNYMTDGIIAFNLDGEVIHANPAISRIFDEGGEGGDSSDSGEGIMSGEGMKSFDQFAKRYGISLTLQDIITNQYHKTMATNIRIKDRFIRIYFAVFTDESRRPGGIVTVLQDITEQEKLDNMRREFVANVSHELRTPLTSIKSYTESLLDGGSDEESINRKFLGVINSEADRMTRLVRDLLQLSSLDNRQLSWNMESASLVDVVKLASDKIQIEAGVKRQMLSIVFSHARLPAAVFDKDRIQQVVLNLLSNAVKYTPEEGTITAAVGYDHDEDMIFLNVSDNGIGIPKEDLPRIFERFYRVDKARSREMGGTGLGLAIAKEIVEAHSGSISLESEQGKGTVVTVRLPLRQPEKV